MCRCNGANLLSGEERVVLLELARLAPAGVVDFDEAAAGGAGDGDEEEYGEVIDVGDSLLEELVGIEGRPSLIRRFVIFVPVPALGGAVNWLSTDHLLWTSSTSSITTNSGRSSSSLPCPQPAMTTPLGVTP